MNAMSRKVSNALDHWVRTTVRKRYTPAEIFEDPDRIGASLTLTLDDEQRSRYSFKVLTFLGQFYDRVSNRTNGGRPCNFFDKRFLLLPDMDSSGRPWPFWHAVLVIKSSGEMSLFPLHDVLKRFDIRGERVANLKRLKWLKEDEHIAKAAEVGLVRGVGRIGMFCFFSFGVFGAALLVHEMWPVWSPLLRNFLPPMLRDVLHISQSFQ